MLAQLYLAYEKQLQTVINETTGKPLFKHFDLWNQNVEFLEEETPFQTPAVFFEFLPIQWKTLGQQVQDADLSIIFHIVTEQYDTTAKYTPNKIRQQMLDYLNMPSWVIKKMQGYCTPFTNGLMRVRSVPNHNHGRYIDSPEEYICRVQDISAAPMYTKVNVKPDVDVSF